PSARQLVRGLIIGALLALLVLTLFTIVGDARKLSDSLRSFDWRLAIPIFLLTMWNYWWRFLKWELYLEALDVPHIPRRSGIPIFLSGFSMSVTPGKIGEVIKAFEVKHETGAPVERVSGAIAAERITDALAMLILAVIGVTQFSYGRIFVGLLVVGAAILLFVLRQPNALAQIVRFVAMIPFANRFVHLAESFFVSLSKLLSPRLLGTGTGIGVISWTGECLAFFLVLVGLGLDATWSLLLIATFVLAVSSLAGGISMLPGGLGVADASVAGMLLILIHDSRMDESMAIAATLLIRFATLWFAVLLGAVMLLLLRRRRASITPAIVRNVSASNGEQA
ncbi:MAG TPA: lysylphosphatidylglycerol synthase transmembrane domain-containing protein, partial [Thermomicrobiales bacterium]|nr:lysylphosphatidylglycerol synthase transmembrane domain-containing protein [Thermomicrobiales bacterium]